MPERVSAHDQVFFMLEGRTTPYSLASLLLLDGPAPEVEELERQISGAVERLPRFSQRLSDPSGVGRARWIDDDDLDLGYHVRRVRLPDGRPETLNRAVAGIMEQHLSRWRPLWELHVIERGDAAGALLLKAHHAVVDGMTGVHDLEVLFGEPATGEAPSSMHALPSPAQVVQTAALAGRGVLELLIATLQPVSRTPFNEVIGPNRVFDRIHSSLEDFKAIKKGLGGTVNDVVVAVVAGGMRRWLMEAGLPVDQMTMRALVPVSRRALGADAVSGNSVAGILAPLPVAERDPLRRLLTVSRAVHSPEARAHALASGLLLELPQLLPPAVAKRAVDIQRVQRYFNLSLTNMRGPIQPLHVCGSQITHIVPVPPLSANAGLIVAVMSYAGSFDFGLVADSDLVPDLHLLAESIEKSIAELRELVA